MPHLPPAPVVLCFGQYAPLLMTRQRLLEREGYAVVTVRSQASFQREVGRNVVELVLQCQTLSDEDARDAVLFLTEHAPGARCIALRSNLAKEVPVGNVDVLDVADGPVRFLQTITRIVPIRNQRLSGSRSTQL